MFGHRVIVPLLAFALFCTSVIGCANAQKATASPGYYPIGYSGDIFSGEFASSEDGKTVRLVYEHEGKTDSFEGIIEDACQAPTQASPQTTKELHLQAIPVGTVLTAYYTPKTVKVDGKKVRTNVIWGIRFDVLKGKKLSDPNRPIIFCAHPQSAVFRAFN